MERRELGGVESAYRVCFIAARSLYQMRSVSEGLERAYNWRKYRRVAKKAGKKQHGAGRIG